MLAAGILLASLLGSVHCAAMCGAFVCAYVAPTPFTNRNHVEHAAYHGGRLISYGLLGAIAGKIGAGVDQMGALAGVSRAAAIAAGLLMVLWAGHSIAVSLGARALTLSPPWMTRVLGTVLIQFGRSSPTTRAGALGLLTTLLPCGWLYAFVVTAAGTGAALTGAATMMLFWLGTMPALLAVGFGAQRLFGPWRKRLPIASAVVVLALGLLSIAGKMQPRVADTTSMVTRHHAG